MRLWFLSRDQGPISSCLPADVRGGRIVVDNEIHLIKPRGAILPLLLLIPKELIATADGEPNPALAPAACSLPHAIVGVMSAHHHLLPVVCWGNISIVRRRYETFV
jgi:hypothetical protein